MSSTDQSNLDTWRHTTPTDLRCPCLPAVWWLPGARSDGYVNVVGRYQHDAGTARVLRSERGHP